MTPEQTGIARRLVALPGWRWCEGMLLLPVGFEKERWLLCTVDSYSGKWGGGAYQTTYGKWWGIANNDDPIDLSDGWLPDLTDPATGGVLLDALETECAARGWEVTVLFADGRVEVIVRDPLGDDDVSEVCEIGSTLGHAAALALLEVPHG